MTRLIVAASCSGFSATTNCAVEQLGLAMMPFLMSALERVGVHFGHDQGNLAVHAPLRGIVDHDGALRRRSWATTPWTPRRPPTSGRCRCRRNRNSSSALTLRICVAERNFGSDRARRGERHHFACRKLAFGQDAQHFAADIAGRPGDGDFVRHDPDLPERGSFPRTARHDISPGNAAEKRRLVTASVSPATATGFSAVS